MLQGTRVLVTGAGGFIGSHLVEALVAQGAKVRAFVRYNGRGDLGMLSQLPTEVQQSIDIVAGDVGDPFFVREAVRGCGIVFHLAALIGIPYSYVAPADYVRVNVQGTVNVLQACREEHVDRVVHTSTSETYGSALRIPMDESHPLQGQSPYSASKIGADKMAEAYHRAFELPVVTVRPFNTYGPRQSMRAFIPTAVVQALTKSEVVMGSLDPVRDLTYVGDTVQGFIQVGLCDAAIGLVVNLGTGTGHTVGDVVRAAVRAAGRPDLPIRTTQDRVRPAASEVSQLVSDNGLARRLAGWEPTWTLEAGLSEVVEYTKKHLGVLRPDAYAI